MSIHRPAFKWEWNLNTLVVLFGFGMGLVAWGGIYQNMKAAVVLSERNAMEISVIKAEQVRLSNLADRRQDNLEFRVKANELALQQAQQRQASILDKLNELTSDVKLILLRVETAAGRQPQLMTPSGESSDVKKPASPGGN